MLPVFIMEDIEHLIADANYYPRKSGRTLLVCDGQALVAPEPDWQCERTRNTLIDSLRTLAIDLYVQPNPYGPSGIFRASLWPMCEAAGPGEASTLGAIMLHIDRGRCYQGGTNQEMKQTLDTIAKHSAERWSAHSGQECAVLSDDTQFHELTRLLYNDFPDSERPYYKGVSPIVHQELTWGCDDPLWDCMEKVSLLLPRSVLDQATTQTTMKNKVNRL